MIRTALRAARRMEEATRKGIDRERVRRTEERSG